MSTHLSRRSGFTLVEILIAVIIIGILAGAFLLSAGSAPDIADASRIINDMKTMKKASLMAFADRNTWPSDRSEIRPYLDRTLCKPGGVCYDLENLNSDLYIKADLLDGNSGRNRKLAHLAEGAGLFQKSGEEMVPYRNMDSVYMLLTSGYSAASEDDPDFLWTFDDPSDMDHFTKLTGWGAPWNIENGALTTPETGSAERYGFGDPAWKDYTIEMTATNNEPSNGYGVYYRADGQENITGYVFQFDPGLGDDFVVREVNGGRESSPIQRIDMREIMGDDFQVNGTDHDISISVTGDQHIIKVDGVEVFNFADDTFTEGSAGLRKWNNGTVRFEEISVTEN